MLRPAHSDENIYFHMAVRTAFDGLWPYRDYFFAHPPLHLLLGVVALKLGALFGGARAMVDPTAWMTGGAALVIMKSLTAIAAAVGGWFVYRAARTVNILAGVLALGSFLFAEEILYSFFTGTIEAVMFAAIGLYALTTKRDRLAGVSFAAATLVALYAAPLAAGMWLALVMVDRRRAGTVALWTTGVLLAVHGAFFAWAGSAYLHAVFLYHLDKPGEARSFFQQLLPLLWNSGHLILAPILAAVALWRPPRPRVAWLAGAGALLCFVFIASLQRVFHFYFVMAYPALAVLAGIGYAAFLRTGIELVRGRLGKMRLAPESLGHFVVLAVVVGLFALIPRHPAVATTRFPPDAMGTVLERGWTPSGFPWIDALTKPLFFHDRHVLGRRYGTITQYLWNTGRPFTVVDKLVAEVRRHKVTTILGASEITPLVALQAGSRLYLDEADTNSMRFTSATTDWSAFLARGSPPDLIVFEANDPLLQDARTLPFLAAGYEPGSVIEVEGIRIPLFVRRR